MIPLEGPALPPWEVWGPLLTGVAAFLAALAAIAPVIKELRPNHGSSMRDAVNKTLARVETLGEQVGDMAIRVDQSSTELAAVRDDVADVRAAVKRHDHELGRANDLAANAAARATQAERRYDEQLSDHSVRLHHLEALTIRRETGAVHDSS